MQCDWLKIVMWFATSNQSDLFQHSIECHVQICLWLWILLYTRTWWGTRPSGKPDPDHDLKRLFQMHSHQHSHTHGNDIRERSSESPLDISSATNTGFSAWNDDVGSMMIANDDEMKHFTSLTPASSVVKRGSASSPDYRLVPFRGPTLP